PPPPEPGVDPLLDRLDLPLKRRADWGATDAAVRPLRPARPAVPDSPAWDEAELEDEATDFEERYDPPLPPLPAVVRAPIAAARVADRTPVRQPALPMEIAPAGGLPPVNLLQMGDDPNKIEEAELVRMGELIRNRCGEFGVE